jgi:hypothetical protein
MKTVYLIPPGVRVSVGRDDAEFTSGVLVSQLQFESPPELTNAEAIFTAGQRRIRVDRAKVIISRYDGQGGENQFGA